MAPATATASPIRRSTFRSSSARCEPAAFPRDASLIDSQGRLMLSDEVIAGVVAGHRASRSTYLFLAAYLLSLAADLDRASPRSADALYRVSLADGRTRGGIHAAPPHPAHQRQLVRTVLPSAHAGVRRRRARGRRGAAPPLLAGRRARRGQRPRPRHDRRCGSRCCSASPSPASIRSFRRSGDRRRSGGCGVPRSGRPRRSACTAPSSRWTRPGWRRSPARIRCSRPTGRSGRGRRISLLIAIAWAAYRRRRGNGGADRRVRHRLGRDGTGRRSSS